MKAIKTLGLAALSLLIVATSCEEERIETNQDRKNISFGMAVGKQTISKAKEFKYWEIEENFKVYSYVPAVEGVFQEFTLTYEGKSDLTDIWKVNPDKIKQPGFDLSYFAYYPEDYVDSYKYDPAEKKATFDYTVPVEKGEDDEDKQFDLIAATKTTNLEIVSLTFYHLLSQVNFALQGMENVQITLTDISVNGVYSTGTYTFGEDGGSWADAGTAVDYGYTPVEGTNATDGENTNISYLGNGGTDNYANTNALMLLPQDFATVNTGATISFSYELKDMSGKELSTGSTEAYLSDFTTAEWKMGKRYLYLIDFTSYLESGYISFSVTVNEWEEGSIAVNPVAQTLEVAQPNVLSIEAAIALHKGFNVGAKYTPENEDEEVDVLKIFPISLNIAPTTNITITNIPDGFDDGDVIKIYCKTNAGAQFIKIDNGLESDWELATPEEKEGGGTVVTLTKATP